MMRFLFIIAILATTRGADHNVFRNCSRIPFCNELRNIILPGDSLFKADLSSWSSSENMLKILLTNKKNDARILELSFLGENKLRIKIAEENSKRYELSDVLLSDPPAIPFNHSKEDSSSLNFYPTSTSPNIRVKITEGPPFRVEIYNENNLLEVVLDGTRFFMDNQKERQTFAFSVGFDDAKRLYGLPSHAVDLELPQTANTSMDPFRLRNSDTAGYEVGSPMALYGSVPVVYGHSSKSTSGIFLHNAAEQWVDISYTGTRPSAYFMVDSGTLDLFVLLGPTLKEVVRQFTDLTGVTNLPQLWTLGYHQCRWSYYTQEQVKEVVALMDTHNFPMDAIWLDIDHTDGKRYFTWNPQNFSDPEEMQRNLSSTNRKLVTISDPHIKVDMNYSVYAGAKEKFFVKWENGSDFEGSCWPGLSSYIDFLNPEARKFYSTWYSYDKYNGSTDVLAGIWNDMNEPSVFDDSLEKTMPFELVHHGNVKHRDIHNIYGFLQTKASYQGLLDRDNGKKRPFVLTRSHFAGSQRYAAVWTGDNTADWPYLRVSYSECLLLNLVGIAFCGSDVGGFANSPDVELLQRWYQAGVWLTFYREHAEETTKMREPYLFDKEVQDVIRRALRLRYKHIPVFYTLFHEHTISGDPINRPLFYDYPGMVDINDHILLGPNILARPVLEQGVNAITVHFPGDNSTIWYRMDQQQTSTVHYGGSSEKLDVNISISPFFYKGGSIVARKDIERPSTTDMLDDPYTLYVNLNNNKRAVGTLYIDDFSSFNYSINNRYNYIRFTYDHSNGEVHTETIGGDPKGFDVHVDKIILSEPAVSGSQIYRKEIFVKETEHRGEVKVFKLK
ncbi:neutral alpha-glucosidase C [Leptinotarsa decemlineata]|uniref:neutral alpha-glucosidase C n=1 Tax=Leptinotarsa decemlineata TaxID=7539 RepID=UPI003D3047EF